jgi:protein TonB
LVGTAGVVLSIGLHAGWFLLLGMVHVDPRAEQENKVVEFAVVEEPVVRDEVPPPPEPEPPPPEVIKPPPAPRPKEASPKPVENAPPPDPTPPAAAPETIADFSGTTLTGEGEGGWVSAVGSGAPMNGPIGRPGATVTGRNRGGIDGGEIGGTGLRVLGEADLSRGPKAPGGDVLDEALKREYPRQAQQQGIEGVARIKVRVMATGKLSPLATVSESYPGFAEACKRSLRGVRFDPPLDRAGVPVATDINYTCEFTVE